MALRTPRRAGRAATEAPAAEIIARRRVSVQETRAARPRAGTPSEPLEACTVEFEDPWLPRRPRG